MGHGKGPVHPLAGPALGCAQAFPTDPVQELLPCRHINKPEEEPCSDLGAEGPWDLLDL